MKKVKIITIILAILLISLISFGGIYVKTQNRMENKVRGYELGMDLKGSRVIRLSVNTGTNEIVKDENGNVVENPTDEDKSKEGYTTEEVKINQEDVLKTENYQKSKEIIERRLRTIGVRDYTIRVSESNGDIIIELPENANTDTIIGNMYPQGKFEILDEKNNTVLMNNDDVKNSSVFYNTSNSATAKGIIVYLDIEFNEQGKQKFKDITSTYTTETVQTTNEDGTTEEKEEDKNVVLKLDDEQILSTNFDETIENGTLQLSLNQATTDQELLQQYLQSGQSIAVLLKTGMLPIQYGVQENQYLKTDLTPEIQKTALIVILAIIAIALLAMIIRYKKVGILGAISCIGFIAIYLLLIRYANVVLTTEGILGILVCIALNYILVNIILKQIKAGELAKAATLKAYKKMKDIVIPAIILFVVASLISWTELNSFGMVIFWGFIVSPIYNLLITRTLLILDDKK